MIQYHCDRCKSPVADPVTTQSPKVLKPDAWLSVALTLPLPTDEPFQYVFRDRHICGACIRGLVAWLQGSPVEAGVPE